MGGWSVTIDCFHSLELGITAEQTDVPSGFQGHRKSLNTIHGQGNQLTNTESQINPVTSAELTI